MKCFLCIDFFLLSSPASVEWREREREGEGERERETVVTFSIAALQANGVGGLGGCASCFLF